MLCECVRRAYEKGLELTTIVRLVKSFGLGVIDCNRSNLVTYIHNNEEHNTRKWHVITR